MAVPLMALALALGLGWHDAHGAASATKGGGLLFRECQTRAALGLYPSSQSPEEWDGCGEDVYRWTWMQDVDGLLASLGLSARDLLKLTRTMGFCPQHRCQLDEVVHSEGTGGLCPQGLCYSKIERGALSYGACCFTDNKFETSKLLGYHNKTQQTPKPIYKASRVVLGRPGREQGQGRGQGQGQEEDTSYEAFINANWVADGLIATQCPLTSTVPDAKRLIVEQNVSLWVHLSPYSPSGDHSMPMGRQCEVFPLAFFDDSSPRYSLQLAAGVSNLTVRRQSNMSTDVSYTLTARVADLGDAKKRAVLGFGKEKEGHNYHSHHCEHSWFHGWADFVIPEPAYEAALGQLVDRAALVLSGGGTVVVSCVSGRGRSGTFAAMALGRSRAIRSVSELVDLVVDMRRRRDGLVETPRQLHLAATVLGLVVGAAEQSRRAWEWAWAGLAILIGAAVFLARK